MGINRFTNAPSNGLQELEVMAMNEQPGIENRLRSEIASIQGTADKTGEQQALAQATISSERASANDEAQFERSTRTLDLSDRQKRVASRRQGLSRALNRARAAGATRRGFTDRAKAAESMGGAFADAMFGQRLSGTEARASAWTQKEGAGILNKANKTASTISTVGKIAGAALTFFSSEDLKHDHGHEPELLAKLKKVRVNRWQYKGDDKTHVGPFSEEFNKEFGIDTDRPDMINVIDALGVTLGAIKELDKKVEARE